MSKANDFKDSSISKRIASNLPRAGLLAIPYVGSAIEKAIFGPLDDKAMDEARRQIHDALEALSVDIRFAQADLKDEIVMLAEKIRATSVELAEKIERLDPILIENFIVQNIKPTIINVFVRIDPEEVRSLSGIAGMLPGEISAAETPETVGEILFDGAVKQGSLSRLIAELKENHPSLLGQFSENPSTSDIENLKTKFADASLSLLKWPTTLGNKIWLHRGELDLLEERVTSTKGTTNLILGKPGTGKSAILALLSQRLINNGIPVLAIKADMLPRSIENLDALQTFLHLPFPVISCLSSVSRDKSAILIIDQLDAISEFVDRNSERLNLLLDLIQIASSIDGVHIVSSCRWFEYQNDIRLTTIEAERISLNPPSWGDVQKVLKDVGFIEEHWSAETQSLLSVPLHLKILLDLKSRDSDAEVPSSLQGLLENIWRQRVISGENGPMKLAFIDILCKRMSEEEELWVPRPLADNHVDLLEELQQVNIIQLDPLGLKIGFVHQTYFDFARARAFVSGQERLSEYVIQRQDGLFIRPVLLSTLDYLRGASHAAYKREVKALWYNKDLRPHLRNLLIEYLGGVAKPNDTEISCILPMLKDEKLKFKVTLAMAGSPGWFSLIKDKYILDFMALEPELSHFIIPVMSRAFSFSKDEVYRLIKDTWLPNKEYDENILVLFTYLTDWDETSVDIICKVANRHQSHWIPHISDLVSQTMPDLAPKIVRADFDRRLQEAIKKEDETIQPPPPSPDASDAEKMIYHLSTRKGREIERLLEHDNEWHELSQIAEAAPYAFIKSIWPWFNSLVEQIAHDPHPFVTGYQGDHSLGTLADKNFGSPDQPITALNDAIVALSKIDPELFLTFFHENINSPYMAIHRLLSAGLLNLAISHHSHVVLEYLTSDPRRLVIGDSFDCHKASRRLIKEVVPYLDEKGRRKLENTVLNWSRYYREDQGCSPEDRFKRKKWNREHRLRLLRSFPEKFLSRKTRHLRKQEERALPDIPDWDSKIGGGGWVGSPMSHEQMAKAKDEHVLNLFEELDDSTEWDHPRRRRDFIGGSVQASREFGKLAEKEPERAARLILNFESGKQERPAAMAVEGLAKSSFPSQNLFKLIEDLVKKGHSSFEFRREVARALTTRAKSDKGLPDAMLNLLEEWLARDPDPSLEEKSDKREREKPGHSILWGYGLSFSLPGGRDVYIEALADGYLLRDPPGYEGFSKVIESRLKLENHPEIWKVTLRSMSFLFNWDREKATIFFDHVIINFKDVIESRLGALEIGRILHLVPKQKTIERWLRLLRDSTSDFGKQAFGELLMLRILHKPEDSWAKNQLEAALENKQAIGIHKGLAFAASYNWNSLPHQDLCTKVLAELSRSDDGVVQEAISEVFRYGEQVLLNKNMKKIIEAILPNDQVLLKSADRLIEGIMDQTVTEPEIIGHICNRVLEAGKAEIQNIGSRLAFTAEAIVSIALTLHRKPPPHRAIGLELFERLIDSNISQARQALDVLDRRPVTAHVPRPMRKRRRRQREHK